MKIIFLGTPEFAVPSLEILLKNGYEIPVVITTPDKKAGRGLQVRQSAVKVFADQAGIKTLQPEKLSAPDFIEALKQYRADLFIVVAFRMLPEAVWKMPPMGTFNLHSSLLPRYRGAAPINRAIMNGETETGVTTFFLSHEIDTGNIIFREKVPIGPDETAGELHDRLKFTGAELVLKTVKAIENGAVNEIPQETETSNNEVLKTAPKIFNTDCAIDWNKPSHQIHNQVRGLSPYPGAFTFIEDQSGARLQLKIYRTQKTALSATEKPGSIHISENRLFISCKDEMLEILEFQQEGKRKMQVSDFLKGFRKEKMWTCVTVN